MATRKRDIATGKEKGKSPSNTTTTKLRGTPNQPSKTNDSSTAPQKQIPSSFRPTSKTTNTDISKQQGKKPASIDTALKPTNARTKPIDKRLSPTQKTRVPTTASLRSSLASGKTVDSQKRGPGKVLKTPTKDAGKQRSLHATPVSNVKKSNTNTKKQDTRPGTSSIKIQITFIPHEKVEHPSVPSVVAHETHAQDQESYIAEAGEKTVQVVGNNEKGADDLVPEDQEPLDIAKIVAEIDHTDAKIVISESSTVLEHHETPLDIKTRDSDDKSNIEEKQQELEEHSMNDTNSSNKRESLSCNSHEEATEEEVKEVAEVAEQETASTKKDETSSGSEAHVSQETEGQELVVEKKQESENAAPKRALGRKDSAVSNDVIEETANKLREQRKNKVRALAGAFETVISLQETK